jgi:hypothetical protein
MIHSSSFKPRVFPILGIGSDAEIDRAQAIDPTITMNRDKVEEIGRDGVVGYIKRSPSVAYALTQNEYGNIEFWQKIVNTATKGAVGETEIDLNDFKTPYFDICAYLTDDDDTFRGTVWYPALRTAGFSINIAEPQGVIERAFDFVGEKAVIFQGDNKYFIYKSFTWASGDTSIDLGATGVQEPAVHPDRDSTAYTDAQKYILRVVKVSGSTSTILVADTNYEYSDSTKLLTFPTGQEPSTGDVIKVYYSSADAPDTQFALNDSDPAGITGESASIYLYIPGTGKPGSSDYIYRLQSVNLEVAFDREDIREIGNKEVVARGVRTSTVTVTLGRILEQFTVEEVLRGEVADYGVIDVEKLSDNISLIVKIYEDNDKTSFKYGFKATGLTPTELRGSAGIDEYVTQDTTLEGEELIITADDSVIGI